MRKHYVGNSVPANAVSVCILNSFGDAVFPSIWPAEFYGKADLVKNDVLIIEVTVHIQQ